MIKTLHLTADEQKIFGALDAPLREGWEVKTEEGTAYETPEELYVRSTIARFEMYPDLEKFITSIREGNFDTPIPTDLSEPALQELCFTIGARGVSSLMAVLLPRVQNDDDILSLASFSQVRHDILKTNAEITVPLS